MFTHKITTSYQTAAGVVASAQRAVQGDDEVGFDGSIAAGPAVQLDMVLDKDDIKALCLVSDKDVTVATNAADGTGGNVFELAAGIPYVWCEEDTWACPITQDIASIYVTNAGSGAAAVKLRFLQDVTA